MKRELLYLFLWRKHTRFHLNPMTFKYLCPDLFFLRVHSIQGLLSEICSKRSRESISATRLFSLLWQFLFVILFLFLSEGLSWAKNAACWKCLFLAQHCQNPRNVCVCVCVGGGWPSCGYCARLALVVGGIPAVGVLPRWGRYGPGGIAKVGSGGSKKLPIVEWPGSAKSGKPLTYCWDRCTCSTRRMTKIRKHWFRTSANWAKWSITWLITT